MPKDEEWPPVMLRRNSQLPILLICLGLAVLLVGASVWIVVSNTDSHKQIIKVDGTAQSTAHTGTQKTAIAGPVSPLLFGTNLGLFDDHDQVITSAPTRTLLQQMHVRIIRMPTRSNLSNAVEVQAAQTIKSIGAVPLVVLSGAQRSNALSIDMQMIQSMNSIFGNTLVYYEFGNEDDLQGVPISTYTDAWNSIVPQLRHLAQHGAFIGPVSYQYNHDNLTTFLQHAMPRPDAISWHEYTCSYKDTPDYCLSHIDHWTNHITDARIVMQTTVQTQLPIMITEWNYAADQSTQSNGMPISDGKYDNQAFMTSWMTKALQTLAANRVFASMQYSCTNTAIPLVDASNALTTQGNVFQAVYQQMIVKGQQPAPISLTVPTQAPSSTQVTSTAPVGSQVYSFEDSTTDGWSGHGSGISNVQNSSKLAYNSSHSLLATLANASSGDYPYLSVSLTSNAPQAGQTITLYVYLATNSVTVNAKLFVVDATHSWHTGNFVPLVPGTWTSVTYTVPADISGQVQQIGVQFNNPTGSNISSDVYVDAVGWK